MVELYLQLALETCAGNPFDCFAVAGCNGGVEACVQVAGYGVAVAEEEGGFGSFTGFGVFLGEPPSQVAESGDVLVWFGLGYENATGGWSGART